MNCVTSGDLYSWIWTFNDSFITQENKDFKLLPNTSLELNNVNKRHQGIYKCTAQNPIEKHSIYKTLYHTDPGTKIFL